MSLHETAHRASSFPVTIGAAELRGLVPMAEAIEATRRGFAAATRGEVTGPLRTSLAGHRVLVMPVEHVSGSGLIKVISLPENARERGVPSIGGVVLWIDAETGEIPALLDGESFTALRTGAASGLATDLLAAPDSRVLAMLGAGGQAADQVAAVAAVRPITEVRVHSRGQERSAELCRELGARHPGVAVHVAGSAAEAVRGADVICTATRSTAPLFDEADLAEHAHVNAIGAYTLEMSEVPPGAFGRASAVVIDQLDAVLAEAGDVVDALDAGQLRREDLIEIGSLLSGTAPPAAGLTIFKSVGIAAQDWSVCELAIQRAREAGLLPPPVALA
jgi:ornithine cyclodeaminase